MAFTTPIITAKKSASGTPKTVTTTGVDTSGANLIILHAGWFADVALNNGTFSDSKSNTWSLLTRHAPAGGAAASRFAYCFNPTVGSAHTFTFAHATIDIFPSIAMQAWAGADTSPFDVENGTGSSSSGNTIASGTGGVTPSVNDELLVAGLMFENNSAGAISIDLSFTISDTNAYSGGNAEGSSMAYFVQTTAANKNPTWNTTNNCSARASSIATFKSAAAGTAILDLIGGTGIIPFLR